MLLVERPPLLLLMALLRTNSLVSPLLRCKKEKEKEKEKAKEKEKEKEKER